MITQAELAHWRRRVPWATDEQVEQDLVLSRLIVEIANHDLLGSELVFRGGTCLHKLWLNRPWRYSEDLDYVRRTPGGVGDILDAIRNVANRIGFERVQTDIGRHPKARLLTTFNGGLPMKIKIEINTFDRSPAQPTMTRPIAVESPWFEGRADVATFALAELSATKIRALYQRKKGRDLFDLWLAVEEASTAPEQIAACFDPYRPEGWTTSLARQNLDAKLNDHTFASDLAALVVEPPTRYTVEAGAAVAHQVLAATS